MKLSRIVGAVLPGRRTPNPAVSARIVETGPADHPATARAPAPAPYAATPPAAPDSLDFDILSILPPDLREPARAPTPPTPRHAITVIDPEQVDLSRLLAAELPAPTEVPAKGEARRATPVPRPAPSGPDIGGVESLAGFLGACLVDSDTGLLLAAAGGEGLDLEAAAAVSTGVFRAQFAAVELLGLDDRIEDILATMGGQLHVIRPLDRTPSVFLWVALDRRAANLGMARRQLAYIDASLEL
jgi:predicted regulator of Ras-like GTPase activity (Roadblock/LC7/MglB family)